MIKNLKVISCVLFMILLSFSVVTGTSFAQTSNAEIKFNQAKEHISKSEYKQAIKIYDEILEDSPNNISTLKMKGIAQINQGDYTKALEQFFKILQFKPNDIISLVGMGVGFGYLGEYQEAQK